MLRWFESISAHLPKLRNRRVYQKVIRPLEDYKVDRAEVEVW